MLEDPDEADLPLPYYGGLSFTYALDLDQVMAAIAALPREARLVPRPAPP